MKRTVLMIAVICVFFSQGVNAAGLQDGVSAKSAVVYDADSGRILWEKASSQKMLIASTTKIMTALLAVEHCDLNEEVLISREMTEVEGSSMYLRAGERYTVEELLYGLMLASGNDAATALAIHISGNVSDFAVLMNRKAEELQLHHTSFENPHGLDGENHYSTAEDMAVLASYAMKNPSFSKIVGTRNISIHNQLYVNHNKLLWQYDGITGIKTGYTKTAGRTLVSCCERNGRRLICVTLSASDDWNDHKKLYDWAYAAYEERIILEKNERFHIPLMNGTDSTVCVMPETDVTAFLREDETAEYIIELPRFVFGSVKQGDRAGQIVITLNNLPMGKVPLIYTETYKIDVESPNGLLKLLKGLR